MKEFKNEYYFENLEKFEHKSLFEGTEYPWEALAKVKGYLKETVVEKDLKENKGEVLGNVTFLGNYFVDEGTKIYPNVVIEGPVHIGKNCKIMPGAYVRPGTVTGDNVVIGFNTEVKNAILQNGCKLASLVFVGDSVLGKSARIGSGIVVANRRFDQANIWARIGADKIDTGTDFFGAVIGDNARVGANCTTVPGTFIGPYTWILPTIQLRGFVPAQRRVTPHENYTQTENGKLELKD